MQRRVFLVIALILCFSSAQALTWDDLWFNSDEQGYHALMHGKPQDAATLFKNTQWQGSAYYRMGDYEHAREAFSKKDDATALYNRGNALAHLGRYQEAIAAYDKALALNIQFDDARFNRDLLKKLLQNSSSTPTPNTMPPFKQNEENHGNNSDNDKTSSSPSENNSSTPNSPEKKSETKDTQQQPAQPQNQTEKPNNPSTAIPNDYQDQQQQQALQNINDDPGGLLKRKFARDYARSQQQGE